MNSIHPEPPPARPPRPPAEATPPVRAEPRLSPRARAWIGLALAVGAIVWIGWQAGHRPGGPAQGPGRRAAISRALAFLARRQLQTGEFRTWVCFDPQMRARCYPYGSPFLSAFVVQALSSVADPGVKPMTDKTLQFLLREQQGAGIWAISTRDNTMGRLVPPLPPDLDCTAVASQALVQLGWPAPANRRLLLDNRNEAGVFRTFLAAEEPLAGDICGVVNANVLYYLGESAETQGACDFLNEIVRQHRESRCSAWYNNDPLPFYYTLSRAACHGAPSLSRSRDLVLSRLATRQQSDGSFGSDLATALAACTLLNLGGAEASLTRAIEFLVRRQARDGSWPRYPFFGGRGTFFGSEEFTTAICLEALARYDHGTGAEVGP